VIAAVRPSLSMWGGRVAQSVYRHAVLAPLISGPVTSWLAPRRSRKGGHAAIRPVHFPQHGHGTLVLDRKQADAAGDLPHLALRARARQRVVALDPQELDAETIVALAAAGVPLELTTVPPDLEAHLGPQLSKLLVQHPIADETGRELHSIRLRRAALPRYWHSLDGTEIRLPPISVLLASRRPRALPAAITQVAAQRGTDVQLVVGLHGPDWESSAEGTIADRWAGPVVVVRAPDTDNLGEVLNELTRRSDGELVTKWDDDDWYGDEHLVDSALAYEYSGAELVGKAAEFVYLGASDRTVRRFATGAESFRWTIAGGTILTSRAWLDSLGGWPRLPRGVDRGLLAATKRAGGQAYRTHGFQYVLRRDGRPGHSHTWSVDDEHFLSTSTLTRDGLDLQFADIVTTS